MKFFESFGFVRALLVVLFFFFSSRRRHTRFDCDWSSDVCSSDLGLSGRFSTASPNASVGTVSAVFVAPFGLELPAGCGRVVTAADPPLSSLDARSGERRVGEEGRSRGGPDH